MSGNQGRKAEPMTRKHRREVGQETQRILAYMSESQRDGLLPDWFPTRLIALLSLPTAASLAPVEAPAWQPIEQFTPKEGDALLVRFHTNDKDSTPLTEIPTVVVWTVYPGTDQGYWYQHDSQERVYPDEWMPLPVALPAATEK